MSEMGGFHSEAKATDWITLHWPQSLVWWTTSLPWREQLLFAKMFAKRHFENKVSSHHITRVQLLNRLSHNNGSPHFGKLLNPPPRKNKCFIHMANVNCRKLNDLLLLQAMISQRLEAFTLQQRPPIGLSCTGLKALSGGPQAFHEESNSFLPRCSPSAISKTRLAATTSQEYNF